MELNLPVVGAEQVVNEMAARTLSEVNSLVLGQVPDVQQVAGTNCGETIEISRGMQ